MCAATTMRPPPHSRSPSHDPCLPPDLAHAPGFPGLRTPSLGGKNILIENTDGEPVGLVWDRYRSLLKSFIIGTGATYQPDVTEQTGTEAWRKVWQDSKTRGYTHLLRHASFLVLQLDPEPPRVCRRLVGLSYAAKAISCNWA